VRTRSTLVPARRPALRRQTLGQATGVAGACGYAGAGKGIILNVPARTCGDASTGDRSVRLRTLKQALDELRPGFEGAAQCCFNNAKFNSTAEVTKQVRLQRT